MTKPLLFDVFNGGFINFYGLWAQRINISGQNPLFDVNWRQFSLKMIVKVHLSIFKLEMTTALLFDGFYGIFLSISMAFERKG